MTEHQIAVDPAGRCPDVVPTSHMMAVMRLCGPELGLGPQVLRSLEVLLSCLAPKRNHHVVFASNATLVTRSGGLSERSLRRHIAELVALDLVERSDSANGKRYCRHNPEAGMTMRFGLNFAKLFARYTEFSLLAERVEARLQKLRYLRCKLRAAAQRILRENPDSEVALETLKAARRNLSDEALETMLAHLDHVSQVTSASNEAVDMTAGGGQNDRHQSNLSKEHIEKNTAENLPLLLEHCTEAVSLSYAPMTNADDMARHAEQMAPMIGISPKLWSDALSQRTKADLTALIWMMVQNLRKISKPAAYFQAVTVGKKALNFDPWAWLQRKAGTIVRGQFSNIRSLSADNCVVV